MLLIDIRSTNASAAEFILYRLKLYTCTCTVADGFASEDDLFTFL